MAAPTGPKALFAIAENAFFISGQLHVFKLEPERAYFACAPNAAPAHESILP